MLSQTPHDADTPSTVTNGNGSPPLAGAFVDPYDYPRLSDAALAGIAGDFVRGVAPHTESDPAALLVQFLVAFGNVIGRTAFFDVEATKHHTNLFAVLVGPTASARKGTSWAHVKRRMADCDEAWAANCIKTGLSSGEGLVYAVHDPRFTKAGKDEVIDPGIEDKRILAYAPEFSAALKVANREGNTLSDTLRPAWDDGNLSVMTRNDPLTATGAHISVIGHITKAELLELMTETASANGFGNRFLWVCAKRSKLLPFGGDMDPQALAAFTTRLRSAIERAHTLDRLTWSATARELWADVYPDLSSGKPGLLGAILSRAEAQTLRLAILYAALRGSAVIDVEDLKPALATWAYCEASARHIFGARLGNRLADGILAALRAAPNRSLTRTEISKALSGHYTEAAILPALARLREMGLAVPVTRPTSGRSVEIWTLAFMDERTSLTV